MLARLLPVLFAMLVMQSGTAAGLAAATDLVVDRHADGAGAHDAAPGDGVCLSVGGGCTLRAAIEEANARAGADVIRFSRAMTITIDAAVGPLPWITDPATISAISVWNALADAPGVTLDGGGASIDGLRLRADQSAVYGLFVTGFQGRGLVLESARCFVGSSATGGRNVIAGNGTGIQLYGTAATGNFVDANWVGLRPDGRTALANDFGIDLTSGAADNTIGHQGSGEGNLVSGNAYSGIRLTGAGTARNVVAGNRIGPSADGQTELGNGGDGVLVSRAGPDNRIGGSLVLGNAIGYSGGDGVYVNGNPDLRIEGNQLGFNGRNGVSINHSADVTVVRNVIVGSQQAGILVQGDDHRGIRLMPNLIGNSGGKAIDIHLGPGVEVPPPTILSGSKTSAAGSACPQCAVGLFSDEQDEGSFFHGETFADIHGRWAYTDSLEGPNLTAVAMAGDGSTSEYSPPFSIAGPRAFVVADATDGLEARDVSPGDGRCADVSGACTLRAAIDEANAAPSHDTITFARPMTITLDASVAPRLTLSQPATIDASGVAAPFSHAPRVRIVGGAGFAVLSIAADGCILRGLQLRGGDFGLLVHSADNEIGGLLGRRNVFAGNRVGLRVTGADAESNEIVGNLVGLSADGAGVDNNQIGIQVDGGAAWTLIGGFDDVAGNVIAGNTGAGLLVEGVDTHGTLISANTFGLSADERNARGNGGPGIQVRDGAEGTTIGRLPAGELRAAWRGPRPTGIAMADLVPLPNTIAHSNESGIHAGGGAYNLTIGGNEIHGNDLDGIRIAGAHAALIHGNHVTGNGGHGVAIMGPAATGNHLSENSIHANGGRAITLSDGGNHDLAAPTITEASPTGAAGTTCARCWVELFSDDADEAERFETGTQADAGGAWTITGTLRGPFLTAVSIADGGDTSALSSPRAILPTPTMTEPPTSTATPPATSTAYPSATATSAAPSPTSTTTPASTPSPTPTSTPTATPAPVATATHSPSATATASPSATHTPAPTATALPTGTRLPDPTATAQATGRPSATPSQSATPPPLRHAVYAPYLLRSPPELP